MNNKLWGAIAIITSIVVLFLLYGKIILHPDSFLFSSTGDAVKNYFTFGIFYGKLGHFLVTVGIAENLTPQGEV